MKDLLEDTQEVIAGALLRLLLVGSHPSDKQAWPIFVANTPDNPNNCISIFGTSGLTGGRLQISGEVVEFPGIMIRVRCTDSQMGSKKANEIQHALDSMVPNTVVDVGDRQYTIHNASRRSGVIPLGLSIENSSNYLFTSNYALTLTNSTPT